MSDEKSSDSFNPKEYRMNTTDPMDTSLELTIATPPNLAGSPRCQAQSKQSGKQCARAATPGHRVCRSHGSGSPQARRAAALRLSDLVLPAIATFARVLANPDAKSSDKIRAAEAILDRAGYPRTTRAEQMSSEEAKEILFQRLMELRGEATTDREDSAN